MPLRPGDLLHHRYRIEGTLGQGGMGAVYHAWDVNLGVAVAVKENLFTTEEYARQFRREATILASLRHPNLPRVTDHFVIEGQGQYLVMDFIEGEDLRQRLERGGPISEREALPWFLDICEALVYLHTRSQPILHRDIKPGNIKVTPEGRALLVDFGLAKVADEHNSTSTGAKAMTPGFSPPEQYGTGRTDPRTDIYSLGATMYAALSAAIPEDALERAMGRAELTPIRRRVPEISSAAARAVEKALAIRSEHRYQSATEMVAALGGGSGSGLTTQQVRAVSPTDRLPTTPLPSRPTTSPHPPGFAPIRGKRRRWPTLLFPVGGLALLIVGAAFASAELKGPLQALLGGGPGRTATASHTATAPSASMPGEAPPAPAEPTGEPPAEPPLPPPGQGGTPAAMPTPIGGGVGQIAFASMRDGLPQIYLINIDGAGLQPVTNQPDGACQPAWSPDGQRLAFISPCRNNRETYPGASLWLINADGSGLDALPTAPGGDFDPAWSPDGTRLAFTSLRDGRPQIYLMNGDGSQVRNLSNTQAHDNQPSWSPAGNELLFSSRRGAPPAIWVMGDDGDSQRPFTRSNQRDNTHAQWSHDGSIVLFEQDIGGIPRLAAALYRDRGLNETRICTEGPRIALPMAEPTWSMDGKWIAFETWPSGGNHVIGLISASCANYALLTDEMSFSFDPAWRP